MAKTKLRDLVVILPGITGSVLQKDGKDIWNFSGQSIWQLVQTHGKSLQHLRMGGIDTVPQDLSDRIKATRDADLADILKTLALGDGITATSLIPGAHIVPKLEKVLSGYYITARLIADNFECNKGNILAPQPKDNFFEFPYDWRRNNRVNALLLKVFLDKQLKAYRESTGLKDAKVILLAHSMGGLISRYYIEVLEGWQDCKALFTFGTPYRGSLNAVDTLANGLDLLKLIDLSDVLRSLPSAYQLLPRHTVLKIGDRYESIAQATHSLPNIDRDKALDAWNFYQEIEDAVKLHLKDVNYLKSYKTIPIVGIAQTTNQSAILTGDKITVGNTELPPGIDPIYSDGDGTVPYWSAIPQELSYEYRETYISEKHGAIQSNPEVLKQVRDRIRGMQAQGLGDVRGPEIVPDISAKAAIDLVIEDVYAADEAITVRAHLKHTQQDFGGIKAEIRSLARDGGAHILELQERSDSWSVEIGDLDPGVYEVTVKTVRSAAGAPTPVRDLFEII
jgi:hypothetical protein